MNRRKTFVLAAVVAVLGPVPAALADSAPPPTYPAAPLGGVGVTTRMSVGSAGAQSTGAAGAPALDGSGEVAFASAASDLGPTVSGGHRNVYLRTAAGHTILISRNAGGSGANGDSDQPAITSNGNLIAFHSTATDLNGSTLASADNVFLYNRDPMGDGVDGPDYAITLMSQGSSGAGDGASDQPAIATTSDGAWVAFRSGADNLVTGDTNGSTDVFFRHAGATTRASLRSTGEQIDGASREPALTVTTSQVLVAFTSDADGVTPEKIYGKSQVYLATTAQTSSSRSTVLVSASFQGLAGDGASSRPSLSNDGEHVAFQSRADNLRFPVGSGSPHAGGGADVYVRNLAPEPFQDDTVLVSAAAGSTSKGGNGSSTAPVISGSGHLVAFVSAASDLGPADSNGVTDVYVRRLDSGYVTRASQSTADIQGAAASTEVALANAGSYVAFTSSAAELVAGDTNGVSDVFLRQRDGDDPGKPTGTVDTKHKTPTRNLHISSRVHASDVGTPKSGIAGYLWAVVPPHANFNTPYAGHPVGTAVIIDGTYAFVLAVPNGFAPGSDATINADLGLVQGAGDLTRNDLINGNDRLLVRAVDRDGNLGPFALIGPFKIDVTGPKVHGSVQKTGSAPTLTPTVKLTWGATDHASGVKSYDVFYKKEQKSSRHAVLTKTTKTHTTVTAPSGNITYYVVARDKLGNESKAHRIGAVHTPVSVATKHFSHGWQPLTNGAFLGGHAVSTDRSNATFRIPTPYYDDKAPRQVSYEITIVATTCPTCGSIELVPFWAPSDKVQSSNLPEIDLHSTTVRHGVSFTRHVRADRLGTSELTAVPGYTRVQVDSADGHLVVIEAFVEHASGKNAV